MSIDPTDLYALLSIGRDSSPAEIEQAYNGLKEAAAIRGIDIERDETWQRVQYAYDVLTNPQRRSLYDSLVAEKAAAPALAFDIRLSAERLPLLDEPQVVYALVTIRPPDDGRPAVRPLNLGLVVDRSTSMRGARLERVQAAVNLILDQLGPDDILSLTTFSDRAEVVLRAATAAGREQTDAAWRDRLAGVSASGGTEIFYGLAAALGEVRRHASPETNSHLILLTDGQTYGDVPDCLRLAEAAAAQGISLSAFGIGSDWNDSFLDALVAPSGGQSGFIRKPEDILVHLEDRLRGLGIVHAQGVRLAQKWPAATTLQEAFKLAPFAQPLATHEADIPLGNVEGRSPLAVLLAFQLAPQTVSARVKIPLTFTFQTPQATPASPGRISTTLKAETASHNLQLLVSSGPAGGDPPAELIEAVRRVNLYRLQEQAWDEAQAGQLESAATRMQQLSTRYLETGEVDLAHQANLEAQRLTRMGGMSPEGRKVLKYGTRALIDPGKP
jgi:Ca-activated chloride channel family protein